MNEWLTMNWPPLHNSFCSCQNPVGAFSREIASYYTLLVCCILKNIWYPVSLHPLLNFPLHHLTRCQVFGSFYGSTKGAWPTDEENPGKPQLGNPFMNAVRRLISSSRVSYLQMSSVGSHNTSGWEKEGKDPMIIFNA